MVMQGGNGILTWSGYKRTGWAVQLFDSVHNENAYKAAVSDLIDAFNAKHFDAWANLCISKNYTYAILRILNRPAKTET